MRKALISVSDKIGIVNFAKSLLALDFQIISTGGTFKTLRKAGIEAVEVSSVTGFSECLDGRVKTLHPTIHGGILAVRNNSLHMEQLKKENMQPIDMVVVNLYPFKHTISKENATFDEAIENIDIGGPAMIRSAAKNFQDVTVVTDSEDYENIINEIKINGKISYKTNFYLSTKAFNHTAHYDGLIAQYLQKKAGFDGFPPTISFTYEKAQEMRYGENPHQKAAFYREIPPQKGTVSNITQLHGKELSFNNINDIHGALELLKEFTEPTVVACKHANPCGVASGATIYEAYIKAYSCDPVSIFGGIIVSNREIDIKTAEEVNKIFVEIVLAPSFTAQSLEVLEKKKNIRLLTLDGISLKQPKETFDIKKVSGGILVQTLDEDLLDENEIKYVTNHKPSEKEMEDLLFTWRVAKHVKSNGISIGKNKQSLGIGSGQVNRIWACKQAIEHAVTNFGTDYLKGAALASDAFFPFSDCVEEAAKAGITAIVQPGGSLKDKESIYACNNYNIAMIFTNIRHFKH